MKTVSSPRVLCPNRTQGVLFTHAYVDDFIELGHPARSVWEFVERLDLSPFLDAVGSREGSVGRPAIDPHLLLALWMYATLDGVDSGRKLARLCQESLPYRWLCGGVAVEYHTLNDFRSGCTDALRTVLIRGTTALIAEGLVSVGTIALDGVRIRASAGSGSFRTAKRLRALSSAVEAHVATLMEGWQRDGVDPEGKGPQRKKRELAERKARLDRAAAVAEALDKVRTEKLKDTRMGQAKRKKAQAALERGSRASATDPDAASLRMADNGHRPAFNTYVSTDAAHGFVVDVHVTAEATDNAEAPKAVERVRAAYGASSVEAVLADAGFRSEEVIKKLDSNHVKMYTPVPKPRSVKPAPPLTHQKPPTAMDQWRERMADPEGAALYKRRSQVVEFTFANFRNRRLQQFRVRGTQRCEAVVLLHALTQNMVLGVSVRQSNKKAA